MSDNEYTENDLIESVASLNRSAYVRASAGQVLYGTTVYDLEVARSVVARIRQHDASALAAHDAEVAATQRETDAKIAESHGGRFGMIEKYVILPDGHNIAAAIRAAVPVPTGKDGE